MPLMTLRDDDGSGMTCLPKDDLRRDGLVDEDDEIKAGQQLAVDRVGPGEYLIEVVDINSVNED